MTTTTHYPSAERATTNALTSQNTTHHPQKAGRTPTHHHRAPEERSHRPALRHGVAKQHPPRSGGASRLRRRPAR
ncbi:hypothetical protein, partial [Kitasatospora sp. NPDC088548]|uniref:hypothetical protein n=1 Tax=Kitasatospora sp. NPDC088548 TaxID=3364075 RepID=UPI00382538B0